MLRDLAKHAGARNRNLLHRNCPRTNCLFHSGTEADLVQMVQRHRGRHSMGTSTTMAPHPSVLLVRPIHADPLVSKANQSIHE